MNVNAKLTFTLRELPAVSEKDGLVYLALTNQQRGLPAQHPLEDGPLYVRCAAKQWRAATAKAHAFTADGKPFVLVVECHVAVKDTALLAHVRGIQVVEGKATERTANV